MSNVFLARVERLKTKHKKYKSCPYLPGMALAFTWDQSLGRIP